MSISSFLGGSSLIVTPLSCTCTAFEFQSSSQHHHHRALYQAVVYHRPTNAVSAFKMACFLRLIKHKKTKTTPSENDYCGTDWAQIVNNPPWRERTRQTFTAPILGGTDGASSLDADAVSISTSFLDANGITNEHCSSDRPESCLGEIDPTPLLSGVCGSARNYIKPVVNLEDERFRTRWGKGLWFPELLLERATYKIGDRGQWAGTKKTWPARGLRRCLSSEDAPDEPYMARLRGGMLGWSDTPEISRKPRQGSVFPDPSGRREDADQAWCRALRAHRAAMGPSERPPIFATPRLCRAPSPLLSSRSSLTKLNGRSSSVAKREWCAPSSVHGTSSQETTFGQESIWAQFPSHAREERNGAAGRADGVEVRDFAPSERYQSGIRAQEQNKNRTISIQEGLLRKFKKMFRLYETGKSDWTRYVKGTRSSISTAGQLLYPDLEILPKTWSAFDEEVKNEDVEYVGEVSLPPGRAPALTFSYFDFRSEDTMAAGGPLVEMEAAGDDGVCPLNAESGIPAPGTPLQRSMLCPVPTRNMPCLPIRHMPSGSSTRTFCSALETVTDAEEPEESEQRCVETAPLMEHSRVRSRGRSDAAPPVATAVSSNDGCEGAGNAPLLGEDETEG